MIHCLPGYVPLPATLQKQALSEISSDVMRPMANRLVAKRLPRRVLLRTPVLVLARPPHPILFDDGLSSFSGALGAPFGVAGLAKSSGSGTAKAGANTSGGGGLIENPIGRFIAVTLGDNRYLVPGLLLLALLCLVAGPLLYMSPSLRKPATAAADGGGEGAAEEGESPPPAE